MEKEEREGRKVERVARTRAGGREGELFSEAKAKEERAEACKYRS